MRTALLHFTSAFLSAVESSDPCLPPVNCIKLCYGPNAVMWKLTSVARNLSAHMDFQKEQKLRQQLVAFVWDYSSLTASYIT